MPLGEPSICHRFAKKPDWVPKELIRMKALMPHSGCRTLADSFNRRFIHKGMSVGNMWGQIFRLSLLTHASI